MPLVGILVFWIWPLYISLPVYLAIVALSVSVYIILLEAMHTTVTTGREGLLYETGKVTDVHGKKGQVSIHGEIWNFEADTGLHKGDTVDITGIEGLTLFVRKKNRRK